MPLFNVNAIVDALQMSLAERKRAIAEWIAAGGDPLANSKTQQMFCNIVQDEKTNTGDINWDWLKYCSSGMISRLVIDRPMTMPSWNRPSAKELSDVIKQYVRIGARTSPLFRTTSRMVMTLRAIRESPDEDMRELFGLVMSQFAQPVLEMLRKIVSERPCVSLVNAPFLPHIVEVLLRNSETPAGPGSLTRVLLTYLESARKFKIPLSKMCDVTIQLLEAGASAPAGVVGYSDDELAIALNRGIMRLTMSRLYMTNRTLMDTVIRIRVVNEVECVVDRMYYGPLDVPIRLSSQYQCNYIIDDGVLTLVSRLS